MPEPRKYFIPPSIRSEGILNHLNRTKGEHNGFDGVDYDKMFHAGVNSTGRARAFGVSNHTNAKWESIYFDEGFGPEAWRDKRTAYIIAKEALKNV